MIVVQNDRVHSVIKNGSRIITLKHVIRIPVNVQIITEDATHPFSGINYII